MDVGGYVWVTTGDFSVSTDNSKIMCHSDFIPGTTNKYSLGSSSWCWKEIWQESGAITGSDRRIKYDIQHISNKFNQFYDCLIPSSYKLINGTSGRTHIGFISQDVEAALLANNITTQDFGGLCYDEGGTYGSIYSLRYDEFIALNTWQIQKLKARVTELETRLAALEALR